MSNRAERRRLARSNKSTAAPGGDNALELVLGLRPEDRQAPWFPKLNPDLLALGEHSDRAGQAMGEAYLQAQKIGVITEETARRNGDAMLSYANKIGELRAKIATFRAADSAPPGTEAGASSSPG